MTACLQRQIDLNALPYPPDAKPVGRAQTPKLSFAIQLWYNTRMDTSLPKHRRVYVALRHDILVGKYDAAAKFPSEGTLMRRFGVSRITVRQAMADLKNDGFLEVHNGSGTYLTSLARNATGLIGLVIPDYSTSPFFGQLCDRIVRAGKDAGYTMLLGELPGDTPAARAHEAVAFARECDQRKVAGVIIEPVELMPNSADLSQEIIKTFDDLKVPVLLIDRDIAPFVRSDHDLVGIDNLMAGFVLGRRLIADGARRLGFLMPPHSASTNLQRMLGVAGAARDAGLAWSSRNILTLDPDDGKGLVKALAAKTAPDVLVCHNDQTAAKMPPTVRVAGFDGLGPVGGRRFPTVRQPLDQLAETAIATLLERIRKPRLPPRQILLNAELADA